MTLSRIRDVGNFQGGVSIARIKKLCLAVKEAPYHVYDLIKLYGGEPDSITREAIFQYVTDKYNHGDYNVIYKAWLV